MGRAIRLVPALVAILLASASAAAASGTDPPPTTPMTTTTLAPAASSAHCMATVGGGARWLRTTTPCEVSVSRGATATIDLTTHFRWGPLVASGPVTAATLSHPTTGGLTGTLHGRSLGAATVTATGSAVCPNGVACPMYVFLWTLRVKVVAPTPTPAPVTVTRADAGHSVTLAPGQRLVVDLAGSSAYTWTTPSAANPAVLDRLAGTAGHATFASVAAGSTTVSAVDNPDCYPACLPPSELFSVTVRVT